MRMRRWKRRFRPPLPPQARRAKSPYNGGDTSGRIVRRLEAFVQSPSLGKPQAVLRRPRAGVGKGRAADERIGGFLPARCGKTALTALGQLNTLVPDYWDGALDTALRVVRTALPLFAAVLLVQLVLLVFARRKRPRRILVFAGTLAVVLGLCVWACFPAWTAGA